MPIGFSFKKCPKCNKVQEHDFSAEKCSICETVLEDAPVGEDGWVVCDDTNGKKAMMVFGEAEDDTFFTIFYKSETDYSGLLKIYDKIAHKCEVDCGDELRILYGEGYKTLYVEGFKPISLDDIFNDPKDPKLEKMRV